VRVAAREVAVVRAGHYRAARRRLLSGRRRVGRRHHLVAGGGGGMGRPRVVVGETGGRGRVGRETSTV
jgi:hypothetical protein